MLIPSLKVYVDASRAEPGKRGVFAFEDIGKGEIIERSPVEVLDSREVVLGFGSLYRHSAQPNAEMEKDPDGDLVRILARENVKKGQEITLA